MDDVIAAALASRGDDPNAADDVGALIDAVQSLPRDQEHAYAYCVNDV